MKKLIRSTTTVGFLSLAAVVGFLMFVFFSANLLSYFGIKTLLSRTGAVRLTPSTLT